MKKFVFILIFLLCYCSVFANKKCDFNLSLDSDDFISLMTTSTYPKEKMSGLLCVKDTIENITVEMYAPVKDSKLYDNITVYVYNDALSVVEANNKVYINIMSFLFKELEKLPIQTDIKTQYLFMLPLISKIMKSDDEFFKSILAGHSITVQIYYKNGKLKQEYFIKGISGGYIKSYFDTGKLNSIIPLKNVQKHGKSEIYDNNSKLWATLMYENDKIVSGKCANNRKTGANWTQEEIENWQKGLEINCN